MWSPPVVAAKWWIEAADVFLWPLLAVGAVIFLIATRPGKQILRQIQRLTIGGFEVEFSREGAIATKAEVERILHAYGEFLASDFDRLAYQHGVRTCLQAVVEVVKPYVLEGAESSMRATVHVVDALYTDALYQLLDYYPGGSGAGRRFSIRFGILGRAWRLEQPIEALEVPVTVEDLITEWGMSLEQARGAARGRQSFVCVVLKESGGGVPLGVLYLDAQPPHAFQAGIAERIAQMPEVANLRDAVQKLHADVAEAGPGIKRYDDA